MIGAERMRGSVLAASPLRAVPPAIRGSGVDACRCMLSAAHEAGGYTQAMGR
jgi:hypothetical protein